MVFTEVELNHNKRNEGIVVEKIQELKALIESLDDDAYKFYYRLNFSAGTRLRKGMQQVKALAKEVRDEIQKSKHYNGE